MGITTMSAGIMLAISTAPTFNMNFSLGVPLSVYQSFKNSTQSHVHIADTPNPLTAKTIILIIHKNFVNFTFYLLNVNIIPFRSLSATIYV